MRNKQLRSSAVAIAYLRASKDEQRLSGDAQTVLITSWAEREGVTIAASYLDQGVSSVTPIEQRPALGEALAALREHRAGHLVVARRDRLGRDPIVVAMIERTVAQRGATVVSASGEGNGESPADQFMRRVLDGAAEYERSLIRARTKAALAAKKARGERIGGVPFGWRLDADGVHLVPCPEERKTIQRVQALRRKGISIRKLVVECGKRGIRSRSGKPLFKSQIERLLQWKAA